MYHDMIVEFQVYPYWMAPDVFLQTTLNLLIISGVVIGCYLLIYDTRRRWVTHRLFLTQRTQLFHLIDQLTIAGLETTITQENLERGSEDVSSAPLGFPQRVQRSFPLDQEALVHQFYHLQAQILSGNARNKQKLADLLNQAEELLEDCKENLSSQKK